MSQILVAIGSYFFSEIQHGLMDETDFIELRLLTAKIVNGCLSFIKDVEDFLIKH